VGFEESMEESTGLKTILQVCNKLGL